MKSPSGRKMASQSPALTWGEFPIFLNSAWYFRDNSNIDDVLLPHFFFLSLFPAVCLRRRVALQPPYTSAVAAAEFMGYIGTPKLYNAPVTAQRRSSRAVHIRAFARRQILIGSSQCSIENHSLKEGGRDSDSTMKPSPFSLSVPIFTLCHFMCQSIKPRYDYRYLTINRWLRVPCLHQR